MENTNKKNQGSFNQSNSSDKRMSGDSREHGKQATSNETHGSQKHHQGMSTGYSSEQPSSAKSQYGSEKSVSGNRSEDSSNKSSKTGRSYSSNNESDYNTDND